MRIQIVTAMLEEAEQITAHMSSFTPHVTGVGKANAAAGVQQVIDRHKPDLVILAGVCASLGEIPLLTTTVARASMQYDYGKRYMDERIYVMAPGSIPGQETLPYRLFPKAEHVLAAILAGATPADYASADQFLSSETKRDRLRQYFSIHAVDMESGAIAQICQKNEVDWLCVKTVTDIVGAKNENVFIANLQDACRLNAGIVENLVTTLSA